MIERKFDRLRSFDERSRNYRISRLLEDKEPISKVWPCQKVLDQGNEGSCVGHGVAHELIADPMEALWVDHDYARHIYLEAQKIDEWPGEGYEGTSVLAGMKYANGVGWYESFYWALTHLETQLGIGYEGPGVAGTNWYSGMMEPNSRGFIYPTGDNLGGHCYLFVGVNVEDEYFTIHNSWGSEWGINGQAYISFDNYEILRSKSGEMAFPIGRNYLDAPPPDPEDDNGGCFIANWFTKSGNSIARVLGSRYRVKAYRA